MFTERELLFEEVEMGRMAEIINDASVKVMEVTEDSNSYGDFLFITLAFGEEMYTLYGLGYTFRGRCVTEKFHLYRNHNRYCAEKTPWNKRTVMAIIKEKLLYLTD